MPAGNTKPVESPIKKHFGFESKFRPRGKMADSAAIPPPSALFTLSPSRSAPSGEIIATETSANQRGTLAHRRPQRNAHQGRTRHADGRTAAPLLAADRRRQRARYQSDQDRAPDGRRPRPLPRPTRPLRPDRPALSAPPRRHGLWLGRGDRHPLQLSRLAPGPDRPLPRTAL